MFISNAVFRLIVLHQNRFILRFVDEVRQLGVRFFVISAPPIRSAFIEKYKLHMSRHEHVEFQAAYREIMSAELVRRGIPVILPPHNIDRNGILLAQYELQHPDDDHHANLEYGSLFWEQFAARLTEDAGFMTAIGLASCSS
jgi:hypothetical protein